MQMQTITRNYVRSALSIGRLPLKAMESVAGDERVAPLALVVDGFQARVKELAGRVLRDEDLAEEGRLARIAVDQRSRATKLEAEAERRRAEADSTLQQRQEADKRRLEQAEQRAADQEAAVEREHDAKKSQLQEQQAKKAEAARRIERSTKKSLTRQERAARATKLDAEQRTLHRERAATAAKRKVNELDDAIDEVKAERKQGS